MIANIAIKEFIQPFERRLAILELEALSNATPLAVESDSNSASVFSISGDFDPSELSRTLSYWREVITEKTTLTEQIRAEATSIVAANGLDLVAVRNRTTELVPDRLPNRRCLRYASHGLHEYRGKFFPQLVRSLANIAKVQEGGLILDPMCGSGTTIVEAKSFGRRAVGFDMNPLSVFVSDVKCRALEFDPEELINAYTKLEHAIASSNHASPEYSWKTRYPQKDQEYLENWFTRECLEDIGNILSLLDDFENKNLRDFFRVCLSNVLRPVSFQKVDDLRTRKDVRDYSHGEVQERFLIFAQRSVKLLVAYLTELPDNRAKSKHTVIAGDARQFVGTRPELKGLVDAIITSPPYATALPYLDTDRLSLIVLGLLPRSEHRARDLEMIGNREVTERIRKSYFEAFEQRHAELPDRTCDLINLIHKLNSDSDVGFRRKNLASLLSKYFLDMRSVLVQSLDALRPGGSMFLIVGNNRTTAGGEEIQIETARHLAEISKAIGFEHVDSIDMEMLASRDIFCANAMPSEQIVWLRRNQ